MSETSDSENAAARNQRRRSYRYEVPPLRPEPADGVSYDPFTETCLDAEETVRVEQLLVSLNSSAL